MKRFLTLVAVWVAIWTILFSGLDFTTIKYAGIEYYPWFSRYRQVVGALAVVISPPSFALAENTYFLWVNLFDSDHTMPERQFYTGNPLNPDGRYRFEWGDGHGGWRSFSMRDWYGDWFPRSLAWLDLLVLCTVGQQYAPSFRKNG